MIRISKDLKQIKTVSELLDFITRKTLETGSYILICVLCALPLFFMLVCAVYGQSTDNTGVVFSSAAYQYTWAALIENIGLLGLLLAVTEFMKSVLAHRRIGESLRKVLSEQPVQLLLAALLLWSAISCILSDDISQSFFGDGYRQEGLAMYFAYYGIFSAAFLLRSERRRKNVAVLLVLFALPVAAAMAFENDWLRTMLNFQESKHASPFCNINHAAYYLCVVIMCAASRFVLCERKPAKMFFWAASFAFLTLALLINSSFGPYLAVIFGLAVMLITDLALKKRLWKRVLVVCLIFAAVTGAYMLSNQRLSKDTDRLFSDAAGVVENNEAVKEKAGSGRWPLWAAAAEFVSEKPVFGYGPDNLGEQYAKSDINVDRPHCVPLQIAASLGLPALAFYLSALIVYVILFFRRKRITTALDLTLLSTGAAYFASSLVGNSMFYTTPYFCLIWGMALRFGPGDLKESPRNIQAE